MQYVVGIDVGGTFTDLICVDETGSTVDQKVASTPADPSIAVMTALERIGTALGMKLPEFLGHVTRICHGTTVSTNAILTLRGAKVGLLTTKGFRDSLEMRTGAMEENYDYTVPPPPPLVPRHLRKGIEERVKWNGEEVVRLNNRDVREALKYFKDQGVDSIAVCFLWSFRNPSHEKQVAEICKEKSPELYLSLSSNILTEIREYSRASTTVINSYVGPILSRYVLALAQKLKDAGFKGELLITQSSAGVMSPQVAAEQAVRTVLSGPACGPAGGIYIGEPYGLNNLMTTDMGGTSFDVALIKNGKPFMKGETKVGGFYHLRLPMVDVNTIGAGGGSIAWLGLGNVLHVGPSSAAAYPGPACYARGGKEPTCTDADLLLGYLNADFFNGGEIKLNPELAKKAIQEKIATPLGIDTTEAARSIVRIINSSMADSMSAVSVRRGENPRKYTLVAAGGAGAVHGAALAKALDMTQILIPRLASFLCAFGAIISDLRHDFVRTIAAKTKDLDFEELNNTYQEMEDLAKQTLSREGIAKDDMYFKRSMDMRYVRQFHEVEVEVPEGLLDPGQIAKVVDRFHEAHETLYAYRDVVETEIMNIRLVGFGKVVKPSIKEVAYQDKDAKMYLKGKREVFFEEAGGFTSTNIYDGDAIMYGNRVEGPAVLELSTTTIVVPPGAKLEVLKNGDFLMQLPQK